MMNRTCKCGGIIRENMKPYWDTLPSCSCQNPTMIENPSVVITTTSTVPLSSLQDNPKCVCGEQDIIGGAEVEIGGVCHRPKNPCYIIKPDNR